MRSLMMRSLSGASLLMLSLGAYGQIYGDPRYRNDPRDVYRERGDYRYERSGPVGQRIVADLERAMSNPYLSRGDRRRIERARRDIFDFQERWARGRFDRHELDEAIGSVHGVVNCRSLPYQDREILAADLARMREFRARQSGGYYNNRPYGYR